MTKNISKITILSLFAAALVAMPGLSRAEGTNAPAASGQTTQPKHKKNPPFHGHPKAVDASAKTITVGTLTLQITSDTRITKDGQPAGLSDGVVGEPVGGAYTKTDDGKLNALIVHFGAKPKK
jgi:ABC-type oligopeptide transport system substrate-binding subunit